MKKNIIWLIILLLLIGGVVYYKQYYPLSQWQLNNSFSSASVQPTERYFNATDIDCGIWYEKEQDFLAVFNEYLKWVYYLLRYGHQ